MNSPTTVSYFSYVHHTDTIALMGKSSRTDLVVFKDGEVLIKPSTGINPNQLYQLNQILIDADFSETDLAHDVYCNHIVGLLNEAIFGLTQIDIGNIHGNQAFTKIEGEGASNDDVEKAIEYLIENYQMDDSKVSSMDEKQLVKTYNQEVVRSKKSGFIKALDVRDIGLDVSMYDGFELMPVTEERDGSCTPVTSDEDWDYISFWTVYGHLETGGVESIIDLDLDDAVERAAHYSREAKIPLISPMVMVENAFKVEDKKSKSR